MPLSLPRTLAGAASACLLAWGPAQAGVMRFEDEDTGTVHYTNVPADPRYRFFQPAPSAAPSPPSEARPAEARSVPPPWPARFADVIRTAVERYQVDRRLVESVITVESAGNPLAVSPKGALGLMQLMPQRAVELGVKNAFDPQQNVDGGVRHLRDLLQRFAGDVTLALAAYNAGEQAVRNYRGVPPYAETQDYVRKVRALYGGTGSLTGGKGGDASPAVPSAPQRIYQDVAEDGTVTFTNLPPRLAGTRERRL